MNDDDDDQTTAPITTPVTAQTAKTINRRIRTMQEHLRNFVQSKNELLSVTRINANETLSSRTNNSNSNNNATAATATTATTTTTNRTYANGKSPTGTKSSYEKMHGAVSREEVKWVRCAPYMEFQHLMRGGKAPELEEVIYEKAANAEGIARITINRPHKRNAFTPKTVKEMQRCFEDARDDSSIGCVILRGQGDLAFCSGGDQSVRGDGGYVDDDATENRSLLVSSNNNNSDNGDDNNKNNMSNKKKSIPRLNVLDLQMQIRRLPKPVIASVAGYCVGGGHILHMICDLTIAADNAIFGQTGPKVGSFDAGYGSTHMARLIGQKKAREMWFLARMYDANEAMQMGLVNCVVPLKDLEMETQTWCREILRNSPTAIRLTKNALNAAEDGQAGIQDLGGSATMLFYQSEEGSEGRRSFMEKRAPDFTKFKRFP